jgi:hypothetical protein
MLAFPAGAEAEVAAHALGNVQAGCDVAQAHPGIMCDAQQNLGVVGQEGPVRHPFYASRFWKIIASFIFPA